MKTSGIYRIVVTRPDEIPKFYIGQASNLRKQWIAHINELRTGKHSNHAFQMAFLKYGESAFCFQVLIICESRKEILSFYEQKVLDSYDRSAIYNIRRQCVDSILGLTHSTETRAKISAALKGIKRSPEVCAKLSQNAKLRMTDPARRAALAEATKKQMTPERRAIISQQLKGMKRSEEAKAKGAASNRGKKHSAERIERTRATWKANYRLRGRRIGRRLGADEIARRQATRAANRIAQGLSVY